MEGINNVKQAVESLIFVSGKPIGIKRLCQVIKADSESVKQALEELQGQYREESRGVRIITRGESVQMVSAPESGEAIKNYLTFELQENLSVAALETLAIIAYRGPITRARIEAIRGVNCVYILRNLLIRGLVDKKRSQDDQRMSVYEVSFEFLRHLGVEKPADLPEYLELSKETSFEEFLKEREEKAQALLGDKEKAERDEVPSMTKPESNVQANSEELVDKKQSEEANEIESNKLAKNKQHEG